MNIPTTAADVAMAAQETPSLRMGVHLVLTMGKPLGARAEVLLEHAHGRRRVEVDDPGRGHPAEPADDYLKVASQYQNSSAESRALILAGAGSGKTRVLTTRIAWLIMTGQVSPGGVLAVTFTNKAAKEMLTRLSSMLPINTRGMWIGTFHGLCNRLLVLGIGTIKIGLGGGFLGQQFARAPQRKLRQLRRGLCRTKLRLLGRSVLLHQEISGLYQRAPEKTRA